MIIDKITKLKNNKYKILIDDQNIITYDNVILDNNLLYKKVIDKKVYEKIISDTKYYDIYNKTVSYILKKRRSEKQILTYLNKFEIDETKIDSIIKKLKDINLINDIEYSKAYINDKIYLSNNGINKIRIDLLNEDIPIEVIDEQIKNIDKDIINNNLQRLIKKKIKANTKYSNHILKQKILNDMLTLGYDKENIINIIDKYLTNDNLIIKKEFDKLYNKLKLKYKDKELIYKLKQKLFAKGFDSNQIQALIDEYDI